ncbi:hypothetical protein V8E54_013356 [Elaphomyces granulatus]
MLAITGAQTEASTAVSSAMNSTENMIAEYGIPHSNRHEFTNNNNLENFIMEFYSADNDSQRIAIMGIPEEAMKRLEKREHRQLPKMRLDYDPISKNLIIKFVSVIHEMAHREFAAMFTEHARGHGITRQHWTSTGAGAHRGTNRRKKEPDDSFKPRTRVLQADRPTLIIEVGVSERLRNDAFFWLTKMNGEVRIVILIFVKHTQRTIQIERWENCPPPRPLRNNPQRPTKVQSIGITFQNGTPVATGAPLILPVRHLFDIIPAGICWISQL